MQDIIEQLHNILDEKGVLTGTSISSRSCSYWDSSPMQAKAIVRPRNTAEVSAILKSCHALGQTVVTHGGLTGVVQGDRSTADNIVLSLERMTRIEEIDKSGRTAKVEAGCILSELQCAAEEENLYFPLDLGARGSCTIGGNVATNAGGINVIRYGTVRQMVLGLEVVLADGTVLTTLNQMLKNNAGYDLKQLFIGTEGTLGVITRVVVSLKERPSSLSTALVALDSFGQVTDFLKFMDGALAGHLSAYEVMWGNYFHEVTEPRWHKSPMERDYAFYVVLEAHGADQAEDSQKFQSALEAAFDGGLVVDAVIPKSRKERDAVWAIREDFEAILQKKPQYLYDVSLPIRSMNRYVNDIEREVRRKWPASQFYALGHIGDGNLHFFISPQEKDTAELHHEVNQVVYDPLKVIGGSVSAEHGIGLEKKAYLNLCRSSIEIMLMKQLKSIFDHQGILNPGKVFDS